MKLNSTSIINKKYLSTIITNLVMLMSIISYNTFASSLTLPLWKDEVEAMGYKLPKPFGLNLSYITMEQGINVESIALSNLKLGSINLDQLLDIQAGNGTQTAHVLTLRGDVWVLPFVNVYALVGALKGNSRTTVNVNMGGMPLIKAAPFNLELEGYNYGVGFTAVGGYGQIFSLVDVAFMQSNLTIIDGSLKIFTISPRIGYDFTKNELPLRLWIGGMYQDVQQFLAGSTAHIDPTLQGGHFKVKQSLTAKWNTIAGAQYQFNDNWALLGELGFGERKSAFASVDYRF